MVQTELAMKQNPKERGQSGSCQGGEAGEGMEGEAEGKAKSPPLDPENLPTKAGKKENNFVVD